MNGLEELQPVDARHPQIGDHRTGTRYRERRERGSPLSAVRTR